MLVKEDEQLEETGRRVTRKEKGSVGFQRSCHEI